MVDHLAGDGRPDAAHSGDPLPGRRKENGDAERVKAKLRDLGDL